jgi:hypothetical protein
MSKKVVYNHKPDPVTKITEYEWIGDKMVLTKEVYKSDLKKNVKIIKKEVLPKIINDYDEALKSDPLLLAEQRMLLNQQMEDN